MLTLTVTFHHLPDGSKREILGYGVHEIQALRDAECRLKSETGMERTNEVTATYTVSYKTIGNPT